MAETNPPVSKLPPVILAAEVIVLVADINPPVSKLPPMMLPAPDSVPPDPAVIRLFPVMLPVAEINPPVKMLPPAILAVTLSMPVGILVCPVPLGLKLMLPLPVVFTHNVPVSTMLPTRLISPPVVNEPVADINPAVRKLPPITLPVAVMSIVALI